MEEKIDSLIVKVKSSKLDDLLKQNLLDFLSTKIQKCESLLTLFMPLHEREINEPSQNGWVIVPVENLRESIIQRGGRGSEADMLFFLPHIIDHEKQANNDFQEKVAVLQARFEPELEALNGIRTKLMVDIDRSLADAAQLDDLILKSIIEAALLYLSEYMNSSSDVERIEQRKDRLQTCVAKFGLLGSEAKELRNLFEKLHVACFRLREMNMGTMTDDQLEQSMESILSEVRSKPMNESISALKTVVNRIETDLSKAVLSGCGILSPQKLETEPESWTGVDITSMDEIFTGCNRSSSGSYCSVGSTNSEAIDNYFVHECKKLRFDGTVENYGGNTEAEVDEYVEVPQGNGALFTAKGFKTTSSLLRPSPASKKKEERRSTLNVKAVPTFTGSKDRENRPVCNNTGLSCGSDSDTSAASLSGSNKRSCVKWAHTDEKEKARFNTALALERKRKAELSNVASTQESMRSNKLKMIHEAKERANGLFAQRRNTMHGATVAALRTNFNAAVCPASSNPRTPGKQSTFAKRLGTPGRLSAGPAGVQQFIAASPCAAMHAKEDSAARLQM